MPTQSAFITYSELFDRVPTKEEVNGIMQGLNAFNTLLLTSRLNTMLWHSMWNENQDICWEDGNRSFDAILVKDKIAVMMEFKGGFLPQDARYSNDLQTFMDALQGRIGAGCHQLARDIGTLFPERGIGKKLRGVTIPPSILWVLPVLVVQDLMLSTPFINYFLNQRFQSERALYPVRRGIEVLPLTVVQITHLENLVEMAEALNLDVVHFFHWRTQVDREMLGDLQDFINQIPEYRQSGDSERFQEIFNKSLNEMYAVLFKNGK